LPSTEELLSAHPAPPWKLFGAAGIVLGLQPVEHARQLLPPLLEPIRLWPGYTPAAMLWGLFRFDTPESLGRPPFTLALTLASMARLGSRKGWFVSAAAANDPGVYGGLQRVFGVSACCRALARFQGSPRKTQFELSKGTQLSAQASFRPLGARFLEDAEQTLFLLKNRRIHECRIETRGIFYSALGGSKTPMDRLLPGAPRRSLFSAFAPQIALNMENPEDVDLRGYSR
jgi:hypothetical protein